MIAQSLRSIAYRWHLGMNTQDIVKAVGKPESEVYNALPEARARYPREAFPMLATMQGTTFHGKHS